MEEFLTREMDPAAVLVLICVVSAELFLHRPVEAVPVYDFVDNGAERNIPQDVASVYNVDEYGLENEAEDDYNAVEDSDSRIQFGLSDVRYGPQGASDRYNVVDYGARGNGRDDSQAFAKAWQAACQGGGARGVPTLYIPSGKTFRLKPTVFPGPCKSAINVQLDGKLVAPRSMSGWKNCPLYSWLLFSDIPNLKVYGSGTLDGQGANWWRESFHQDPLGYRITGCSNRPTTLKFHNCQNLKLSGIRQFNSPRNHLSINMCSNVTISYLKLVAPEDSPNTDGINIGASSDIKIHDLSIQTGDDCIAINGNTSRVNITNVKCGPGHGISIGSLGAKGSSAFVEDIYVGSCTFIGSDNGARIKTWQGGSGTVSNVVFEDIALMQTKNPIIIDQFYCNGGKDCGTSSKNLKITKITYNRIKGTSASKNAVTFNCASTGCTGIVMNQVNIGSAVPDNHVTSVCKNAELSSTKEITPKVYC